MTPTLWILAILALGVLIVAHEAGHYFVARWSKMRVERFSIGFGPSLLKFERNGTIFQIAPVPLGGFVQIAGLNPQDEYDADDPHVFPNRPVFQRLATIFAGPATNYLFALVLAFAFFLVGGFTRPTVRLVEPQGAATRAGVQPGDVLVKVDGHEIYSWDEVDAAVRAAGSRGIDLTVRRGDRYQTTRVVAGASGELGAYPSRPVIAELAPNMPAVAAGLQPGDELLKVDGQPVVRRSDLTQRVLASGGKPVVLVVQRGGVERTVRVVPKQDGSAWRIGVVIGDNPALVASREPLPVGRALRLAAWFPVKQSQNILSGLWRMVTGRDKGDVTGPIGIAREIKRQFEQGFVDALLILAMLNVYLGLFNLLPLPALDGGRLAFLAWEGIARRRVNPRVEAAVHTAGFLMLVVMLVFVTFKDVRRLWGG
jgi:regulator of sigma E protease